MSRTGAFFLGALGGLLPILVSLLTVDLAALIDHHETLTLGNYVGYGIRLSVLLTLGGTVAVLNSEVQQPFSLVQLGIAAPALVTSFINAVPAAATVRTQSSFISIISSAHAEESRQPSFRVAGGFLGDVIDGIRPGFGRQLDEQNSFLRGPSNNIAPMQQAPAQAPLYPPSTQGYPSALGNYCVTQAGVFGPGPLNPIGAPCSAYTPMGTMVGYIGSPYGQGIPPPNPPYYDKGAPIAPSPSPTPSNTPAPSDPK